jgi:hypothetical protein
MLIEISVSLSSARMAAFGRFVLKRLLAGSINVPSGLMVIVSPACMFSVIFPKSMCGSDGESVAGTMKRTLTTIRSTSFAIASGGAVAIIAATTVPKAVKRLL